MWCAFAVFAVAPCYLAALWVESKALALLATFLATALTLTYSPAYVAACQTICDPRTRGATAGVASFVNNIVGGAVCTFIVGALSDWWRPTAGEESRRLALTRGTVAFCVLASLMFVWVAFSLKRR